MKICFVCHGNICRSPMAEFIMKQMVSELGLEDSFYIESTATSTEEIGNGVYPPVKILLEARGIDCSKKRARRITQADYENFDYILCMDDLNMRIIKTMGNSNNVYKLLDFTRKPHKGARLFYSLSFFERSKGKKKTKQRIL